MKKTKYYTDFQSKKEFKKWLEENLDKLDFFEDFVTLEYYLKEEEYV